MGDERRGRKRGWRHARSCFPWGGGTLVAHHASCATLLCLLSPAGCWIEPTPPASRVLLQNWPPNLPQNPWAAGRHLGARGAPWLQCPMPSIAKHSEGTAGTGQGPRSRGGHGWASRFLLHPGGWLWCRHLPKSNPGTCIPRRGAERGTDDAVFLSSQQDVRFKFLAVC